MKTKKSLEGYLLIDNRATHGGVLETSTLTCSHCQRQIIRNPDRTRDRAYCPKCDHYICDGCEMLRIQTGMCRPFKQVLDMAEKQILQGKLTHG